MLSSATGKFYRDRCLKYDHSDTGNAQIFNELYGTTIRYDSKNDRWLNWKNAHRWYEMYEQEVTRLAIDSVDFRFDLAKSMEKESAKREVSFAIQSRNNNRLKATMEIARQLSPIGNFSIRWNNQPNLLAVGNGVVNLANSKLRPGERSDFISQGVAWPYMADEPCPVWKKFLSDIMLGNQEHIDFLQRAIGYSLTGFTKEQVFFVLHGAGSNGKSVLLNILRKLLESFSRTVRFAAFDQNNTSDAVKDLAELDGVRAVFVSESPESSALNVQTIKSITGGEELTVSRKYGHPFSFVPQYKLWMATNHLPTVADDSEGFWRRIIVIPFLAQFEGKNRDLNMQSKLEDELIGIMAWAIEGARMWTQKGLSTPDDLLLKILAYRQEQDDVGLFIDECCLQTDGSSIQAGMIYNYYTEWATELGRKPITATAFGRRLARNYEKYHTKNGWSYRNLEMRINIGV